MSSAHSPVPVSFGGVKNNNNKKFSRKLGEQESYNVSGGRSQVHFVLCRLELARITTAKTSGKVICPKDTVENWSSITPTQCQPASDIKNMYLRQPLQPSSNGNSYNPFISHQ